MMKTIFTLSAFVLSLCLCAQDGKLDKDFGTNGQVKTNLEFAGVKNALAIQANGKIVVGGEKKISFGHYGFGLKRYLIDGTPDSSFGNGGTAIADFIFTEASVSAVALQKDGKIIAGGNVGSYPYRLMGAARFKINGELDSSFGINGKVYGDFFSNKDDQFSAIVLQPNGKIVLVGYTWNPHFIGMIYIYLTMIRLNYNGSIDSSFGINGKVETDVYHGGYATAAAAQTDGKIIVAGYNYGIAFMGIRYTHDIWITRYNLDGSEDKEFGFKFTNCYNISTSDEKASSLLIQPDGKILVGGYSAFNTSLPKYATLLRYNKDGTLDNTFGKRGIQSQKLSFTKYAKINCLALQPDNKIVGVYTYDSVNNDYCLVRYTANGLFDSSFGHEGRTLTNVGVLDKSLSVAMQSGKRIVVFGQSDTSAVITRYYTHGSFFANINKIAPANISAPESMGIQPNPSHNGKFKIDLGEMRNNIRVTVSDNNGRYVYVKQIPSAQLIDINLNKPKGIYFLQVSFDGGRNAGQLVIE